MSEDIIKEYQMESLNKLDKLICETELYLNNIFKENIYINGLSWEKYNGKFRIMRSYAPLIQMPIDLKIEGTSKIPVLIEAINKKINSRNKGVSESINMLEDKLKLLNTPIVEMIYYDIYDNNFVLLNSNANVNKKYFTEICEL